MDLLVTCLFLFSSHFLKFFPLTLFHSSVSTVHFFFLLGTARFTKNLIKSQSPSVSPNVPHNLQSRALLGNVLYPLVFVSKAPTVRG